MVRGSHTSYTYEHCAAVSILTRDSLIALYRCAIHLPITKRSNHFGTLIVQGMTFVHTEVNIVLHDTADIIRIDCDSRLSSSLQPSRIHTSQRGALATNI